MIDRIGIVLTLRIQFDEDLSERIIETGWKNTEPLVNRLLRAYFEAEDDKSFRERVEATINQLPSCMEN